MKFSNTDFFSKCDQIRSFLGFVTFTEEILNGKLHFLCSVTVKSLQLFLQKLHLNCFTEF